jgi:hypothetical protein
MLLKDSNLFLQKQEVHDKVTYQVRGQKDPEIPLLAPELAVEVDVVGGVAVEVVGDGRREPDP